MPLLLILIAIGIFFAYIHPTYTGSIKASTEQIKQYDKALAAAEDYRNKESELLSDQNAINLGDRRKVETFLPDGVDNVQLILDLDALASRTGVRLSNFSITRVSEEQSEERALRGGRINIEEGQGYESITLSVTALGTYQAFRKFLDGIEKSLRILDVVGLDVSATPTGVYTYGMTIKIYWLR